MKRIAIVGSGLIGSAWAIVFARAGHQAALYDAVDGAVARAQERIRSSLEDLERFGLIDSAAAARDRIVPCNTVAEALDGAVYAQESVLEDARVKAETFAAMDSVAASSAVLASSSSAIPGSRFLAEVPGRRRCLIAHPGNPPSLLPLVELIPTPWTTSEATESCRALMEEVGQVPVLLNKEIEGFVMNRLQAAVACEAMALVRDGVMSPEDIDKTMRYSLGLRWSFMGPFETMDLNAPAGFKDYAARYRRSFEALGRDLKVAAAWDEAAIEQVEAIRRARVPGDQLGARQAWRDRRLMALIDHIRRSDQDIGS